MLFTAGLTFVALSQLVPAPAPTPVQPANAQVGGTAALTPALAAAQVSTTPLQTTVKAMPISTVVVHPAANSRRGKVVPRSSVHPHHHRHQKRKKHAAHKKISAQVEFVTVTELATTSSTRSLLEVTAQAIPVFAHSPKLDLRLVPEVRVLPRGQETRVSPPVLVKK
jgi:hypothetical protein